MDVYLKLGLASKFVYVLERSGARLARRVEREVRTRYETYNTGRRDGSTFKNVKFFKRALTQAKGS